MFSCFNNSNKEKFYINFQIAHSKNFFKRIYFILKKINNYFNLCLDKSDIYNYYFQNSKKYKNLIEKYDFVISDFRLNNLYNPNIRLIFEAAKSKNTKLISWIYSWDNAYHSSVMKHADYVLIWSNFFKKTMIYKHKYKRKQIVKIGALQFDYLKKKTLKKKSNKKRILFACSYGSDQNNTGDNFVKDEINFLKSLSKCVNKINNNCNIFVRPYPSALNIEYKDIKTIKNIKLQEYGKLIKRRNIDSEKIRIDNNYKKKIDQIMSSEIVISFGSTFNIESAILNKIVLHIDYSSLKQKKLKSYNYFKNQMEYLKVLKGKNFPNIIRNGQQLDSVLYDILINNNKKKYLKYNSYLKQIFYDKKLSVNEIKKNLSTL